MQHKNLVNALLATSLVVPLSAFDGHASESEVPPLEQAIEQAKQAGKPLLVEFSTSWCGPCKTFAAEVLPRQDVQRALAKHVVFVAYDAEVTPGIAAANRLEVSGYPNFVIVDAEGKVRARRVGTMSATEFIQFVGESTVVVLSEDDMSKRLAATPDDPKLLLHSARFYGAKGQRDKADALYKRAIAADRDDGQGVANQASWERQQQRRYRKVRADLVRDNMNHVGRYPGSSRAIEALSLVAYAGDVPGSQVRALADSVVAATDDGVALNRLVYVLLGAGLNEAAVAAGEKQVALAPDQANPYDTLAEAKYAAGDQKAAVAMSEKAVSLAENEAVRHMLEKNLARFSAPTKQPAPDIELARQRGLAQLARLPIVDPTAPEDNGPSRAIPGMSFYRTIHGAYTTAGKACGEQAGKLSEAYVRLEFKPGTNRIARVVTLEPGAPARLKNCLRKHFQAAELPAEIPMQINNRYTGGVSFADSKPRNQSQRR